MKKTKLEQFTLQKVKTKGQGLETSFEVEESNGAEIYHDVKTIKSDKIPTPDLKNILNALRDYIANIFYFSMLKELRDSKIFMANEDQINHLNEKYETLKNKITITGVSISGKDANRGLIITAKLKTETGQEVAINSQRLKFNGTKYGFEEDLENLMIDLEGEVFEYVVNGKQAQLEMAFEEDTTDDQQGDLFDGDNQELVDKAEEALKEDESVEDNTEV